MISLNHCSEGRSCLQVTGPQLCSRWQLRLSLF